MNARPTSVDPAVAALVAGLEKKQTTQRLPVKERKAKAKEADRQARRNRLTIDINPAVSQRLADLACELGCSISQLAEIALSVGLNRLDFRTLQDRRRISKSPRFEWVLDVEEIINALNSKGDIG